MAEPYRRPSTNAVRSVVTPASGWDTAVLLEGGTASAAQEELPLRVGTIDMDPTLPGVPVVNPTELGRVAVSWAAGSTPAGSWTLTFWQRTNGGTFNAVATFSVNTS